MARSTLLVLVALLLSACGPRAEQEASVRSFFENIRTGQLEAVQGDLAANLRTAESQSQLQAIRRDYIPTEAPTSGSRINWSTMSIAGGDTTSTFVHRYDYDDRVLVVTTVTRQEPGGQPLVEGFHVNVTPRTPEVAAASEFTLLGKPPVQLAFFAAVLCSVALMLIALLGTIFTKGFKRKWLFAILSLAGAPTFVMNWATGEWAVNLTLSLISAGVTRGAAPLDPWMMQFHIPIGAIITLSLLLPHWMSNRSPTEEHQGGQN